MSSDLIYLIIGLSIFALLGYVLVTYLEKNKL